MASLTRLSAQATTTVVLALAEHPATRPDLEPGRLYRALMRLADLGLLEAAWEAEAPADRLPRHRDRLSGPGRAHAAKLAAGPSVPARTARLVGGIGRRPRLEGT